MQSTPAVRTCSCCSSPITAEKWAGLPWIGTTEIPAGDGQPGYFLEQRNCDTPDCGSTLAIERPLTDADARRDAEVTEQRRPKATTPTERFRILTEQRYRLEEGDMSRVFAVVRP